MKRLDDEDDVDDQESRNVYVYVRYQDTVRASSLQF
jgi:hypothetical protein